MLHLQNYNLFATAEYVIYFYFQLLNRSNILFIADIIFDSFLLFILPGKPGVKTPFKLNI
jgi:hypothetical protein